jgi:hypothetical protein
MRIVQEVSIDVSLEQLLQLHGVDGSGRAVRRGIVESYRDLIQEGLKAARPVYGYRSVYVAGESEDELLLETGHQLASQIVARNLAGSEVVYLICCTIGPDLESLVAGYRASNQPAKAYVLDSVGSLITDQLANAACSAVDDLARNSGLLSTVPLSPGYANWPLAAQDVFYDLLDFKALGVSLSDVHIMSPLKSCTLAVGVGGNVKRLHDGATCDFCQFNGRCNLQKTRDITSQREGSGNG